MKATRRKKKEVMQVHSALASPAATGLGLIQVKCQLQNPGRWGWFKQCDKGGYIFLQL